MIGAYLIGIVFMLISLAVSARLKRKFAQYSKTPIHSGLSGKEIAEQMLHDNGIYDVQVTSVQGHLTDHYNPVSKTVNLSPAVYNGHNAASAAVASHECGHAVQHAKAYAWLGIRSALVPVVNVTSSFMQWIILAGILLLAYTGNTLVLTIGVILFAMTTLFTFITLPVEFDASRRALAWIERRGIVTPSEHDMSKDALKWAALTYVVAALGSLATLLYYASLLFGRRD